MLMGCGMEGYIELKPDWNGNRDAIEAIEKGLIDLVINIPRSLERNDLTSGYLVRRKTVDYGIGLLTNIQAANLFVDALWKIRDTDELMVKPWREYC